MMSLAYGAIDIMQLSFTWFDAVSFRLLVARSKDYVFQAEERMVASILFHVMAFRLFDATLLLEIMLS